MRISDYEESFWQESEESVYQRLCTKTHQDCVECSRRPCAKSPRLWMASVPLSCSVFLDDLHVQRVGFIIVIE